MVGRKLVQASGTRRIIGVGDGGWRHEAHWIGHLKSWYILSNRSAAIQYRHERIWVRRRLMLESLCLRSNRIGDRGWGVVYRIVVVHHQTRAFARYLSIRPWRSSSSSRKSGIRRGNRCSSWHSAWHGRQDTCLVPLI